MDICYTVQIWKEGDQCVAHAMPLDGMSSGYTPQEARGALDEAVHLFLATAAGAGTLGEVLEDMVRNPYVAVPREMGVSWYLTSILR